MSIHINKFIDRVRGFEARGARDFVMTLNEARDLHADITRLLLELNEAKNAQQTTAQTEVVEVRMDGGSFKI